MDSDLIKNVANALSTITIISCLFLKVPQIMYLRQKQSAEGIFVQALILEITGFSIMTLYNYTNGYGIMTYMEYPIILLQVYIMLFYVLKYKRLIEKPVVPICTIIYTTTVLGFIGEVLPKSILSFLVPFCTPLSGFAKVTYIYGIVKAANADAVSLTTWIISIATNLSRIFTVFVDSGDVKLMSNFMISSILSSLVLITALYYKYKKQLQTSCRTRHHRQRAEPCRCHASACPACHED